MIALLLICSAVLILCWLLRSPSTDRQRTLLRLHKKGADLFHEDGLKARFQAELEIDDVTKEISIRGADPDGRPFCFTGRDLQTAKRAVQAEMAIRYQIAPEDVELRL